jgi:hypothetical protein
MKRWVHELSIDAQIGAVELFMTELTSLCKQHGLSLSHEDGQGAFIVDVYSESNISWINAAGVSKSLFERFAGK